MNYEYIDRALGRTGAPPPQPLETGFSPVERNELLAEALCFPERALPTGDSNKGSGLIRQGNIDDAFLMDVDDIQSLFGNKYDDAILQAMDRIPSVDDLP